MSDKYLDTLRRYWGYSDFRGIQRQIIESIGSGHDTLGLMPTGGGKSITFQVPALTMQGVCIVITPLIALMRDQVEHLRHRGIRATAIHSGLSHSEILTRLDNCVLGGVKLLYVSPERLSSELFQTKLRHMKVSLITVDEAHCISQWGYDFRPSYLEIARIRDLVPDVPVLALTATATPQVVDDIQQKLRFHDGKVFRMSFQRKNLAYVVRHTEDKMAELVHVLSSVKGSAIVYVRTRKRTREVCKELEQMGMSATFYNAGLEPAVKNERQRQWQTDEKRIMVATNAFGMGIDKPDVRLVVHYDAPSSLEAYFQEAGRGGRDGLKAYAVLFYDHNTRTRLLSRVNETYPKKEEVRAVYEDLAYFYQIGMGSGKGAMFNFDIIKFCKAFRHSSVTTDSALQLLDRAGYIEYEPFPDFSARLRFLLSRNELSRLDSLSPTETTVITTLLRTYGGLFTDYQFIHESYIAEKTGLKEHQLYNVLKGLSTRRIINFVPHSVTPYIRYRTDRVEADEVELNSDVYDNRKAEFEHRIATVIQYAETDNRCRSEMLVGYFGEQQATPCGICDYCAGHKERQPASVRDAILHLLADHNAHSMKQLYAIGHPMEQIDAELKQLLSEEKVQAEGDGVALAR